MSRSGLCAVVIAALLLTSACTVETGGSVGLTRDAEGHLLAVVVVCQGYIDGLTLYRDDTSNPDSRSNDRGEWVSDSPIKTEASLDLSAPGPGWTSVKSLEPLDPAQEFRIYGWTHKNRWSAGGPTFRVSDIARLDRGHILVDPSTANEKRTRDGLVPIAEFRALACG